MDTGILERFTNGTSVESRPTSSTRLLLHNLLLLLLLLLIALLLPSSSLSFAAPLSDVGTVRHPSSKFCLVSSSPLVLSQQDYASSVNAASPAGAMVAASSSNPTPSRVRSSLTCANTCSTFVCRALALAC